MSTAQDQVRDLSSQLTLALAHADEAEENATRAVDALDRFRRQGASEMTERDAVQQVDRQGMTAITATLDDIRSQLFRIEGSIRDGLSSLKQDQHAPFPLPDNGESTSLERMVHFVIYDLAAMRVLLSKLTNRFDQVDAEVRSVLYECTRGERSTKSETMAIHEKLAQMQRMLETFIPASEGAAPSERG